MDINELKQEIEQRTGVPATLLTGETAEENISQAKALLVYKKESAGTENVSPREEFTEWMNEKQGIDPLGEAGMALSQIEESMRIQDGGYPIVKDGGTITVPDGRTVKEQFAEWAYDKMAWDPFKGKGGWKKL